MTPEEKRRMEVEKLQRLRDQYDALAKGYVKNVESCKGKQFNQLSRRELQRLRSGIELSNLKARECLEKIDQVATPEEKKAVAGYVNRIKQRLAEISVQLEKVDRALEGAK